MESGVFLIEFYLDTLVIAAGRRSELIRSILFPLSCIPSNCEKVMSHALLSPKNVRDQNRVKTRDVAIFVFGPKPEKHH